MENGKFDGYAKLGKSNWYSEFKSERGPSYALRLLTDVFGLLNFPQVQRKGEPFAFSDRVSSSLKTVGKGALGMNWVR